MIILNSLSAVCPEFVVALIVKVFVVTEPTVGKVPVIAPVDVLSDSVNIPSRLQGLRCSGIALKQIDLNFADTEDSTALRFNFSVFVDITSVSNSY